MPAILPATVMTKLLPHNLLGAAERYFQENHHNLLEYLLCRVFFQCLVVSLLPVPLLIPVRHYHCQA